MNDIMSTPVAGPAPESQVARDIVRRATYVGPVWVLLCAAFWGVDGAASAGYGLGLVMVNFMVAAGLLTWAARISLSMLMVAALGGFMMRLALISLAVWLVKDASWVALVPLGITIIIAHLGLLVWETRHVSASLAFPGLKPAPSPTGRHRR
jgi:hypothetical protein